MKMRARCLHRHLEVRTEHDRCSWVVCANCKKSGPKKHSYLLAILAWGLHLTNQHPRVKSDKQRDKERREVERRSKLVDGCSFAIYEWDQHG